MKHLAPNLATPADVATVLISRVIQAGCQHFVDAGCGSGELLLAVARACPGTQCHGLELSATLCAALQTTIRQAALPNATVHRANLRNTLDAVPAADFIFAYVGGAMHQALAIHLAKRRYQGTLFSALYPCYPFPITQAHAGSLPAFEYAFPACATQLLWDAYASVVLAPQASYSLLNRAATFFAAGRLAAHVRAPGPLKNCVAVHLAQAAVATGQTLMLDLVVDTTGLAGPVPPTLIEIGLTCDGVALWPAHQLIMGYHPTAVVELALAGAPDEELLRSVHPLHAARFYQRLATYHEGAPAVQSTHF